MSSVARSTAPAASASENQLKVPILSASKQAIIDVSHQRSMSLAPLKAALECDPAASLNLFSKINVTLKRHGKLPVNDISRAVLFMGFPDFVSDVRTSVALEDVADPNQIPDLLKLLNRAHYTSRQTRTIGELAGGMNPDEIQAASLTQTALGYVEALGATGAAKISPDLLLGLLPKPSDSDAEAGRQVLSLGSRFADATITAWDETALDPLYEEIAAVTRRPADEVSRRMKQTAIAAARVASHYKPFASARLLMMNDPLQATTIDKPVNSSPVKKPAALNAAKRPPAAKVVETQPKASTPRNTEPVSGALKTATRAKRSEPHLSPLETSIKKLERAAQKPQSASKILRFTLDALIAHLDLKLTALLVVDSEQPGTLTLRSSSGMTLPEATKRVPIKLDDNALIRKMLERPLAVHFDPTRHSKGLAGLPLKLFGGRAGFLYSVERRGKPLGVIVACRPKGQTEPSAADLETFTRLCRAALSALNPKSS